MVGADPSNGKLANGGYQDRLVRAKRTKDASVAKGNTAGRIKGPINEARTEFGFFLSPSAVTLEKIVKEEKKSR